MAKGISIAERVETLVAPCITELGYRIWDVEYVKEGTEWYLRITLDSDDGIDIDDCEKVSRAINPIIDEADPIEDAYYLEVSSPGVERELRTQMHIDACEGWNVEVKLYAPLNGAKKFRGVLQTCAENGDIRITAGEETMTFARESVAKISTYFEF